MEQVQAVLWESTNACDVCALGPDPMPLGEDRARQPISVTLYR